MCVLGCTHTHTYPHTHAHTRAHVLDEKNKGQAKSARRGASEMTGEWGTGAK